MSTTQVPGKPQFIWKPGPTPVWLSSPDTTVIETLCRSHLQLPAHCQVAVTFLAEGAFNKLYTIAISDRGSGSDLYPPRYVFRATFPAEPFYKTASEVATYSYLREHTTIPVPRIIAHCSSAENDLGCEWILMEKVPGVPLESVWKDIDLETKKIPTKLIADFWRQLQEQRFCAIGNLYFRKDIDAFNGAFSGAVPTKDEKYVLGPTVTAYLFAGGRKIRLPRNLGPYSNDEEYITALADSEREDMKLLLSADARSLHDFDEDLCEDAEEIVKVLNELQPISTALFPSRPRDFSLFHHDLSLNNILIDPTTYEITGVVDWECVGPRPHWEDKYPQFLLISGTECPYPVVKPLSPGDTDEVRVEHWQNWERRQLHPVFDRELGDECDADDGKDEARQGFRQQLDAVSVSHKWVRNWIKTNAGCM